MKLPHNLNHSILELYTKDSLEFKARYIYGLKKKSVYKNFAKRVEKVEDEIYDESIFWKYQRQRIIEALNVAPLNETITVNFEGYEVTENIDYILDSNTVVCFTTYSPPSIKQIRGLESLRLMLCGYCVEQRYQIQLESLEYWYLKGYKDIIEKVVYTRSLMEEVMMLLKEKIVVSHSVK